MYFRGWWSLIKPKVTSSLSQMSASLVQLSDSYLVSLCSTLLCSSKWEFTYVFCYEKRNSIQNSLVLTAAPSGLELMFTIVRFVSHLPYTVCVDRVIASVLQCVWYVSSSWATTRHQSTMFSQIRLVNSMPIWHLCSPTFSLIWPFYEVQSPY